MCYKFIRFIKVIGALPQIDVKITITGDFPDDRKPKNESDKSKVPKIRIDMKSNKSGVYSLFEDEEYVISLEMSRQSSSKVGGRFNGKAYTPKYSKPKDENWIVILGENTSLSNAKDQLVGLKRVTSLKRQQTTHVIFKTPRIEENIGRNQYNLTVYLMSDVYLGLDQQFEISFKLAANNNAKSN